MDENNNQTITKQRNNTYTSLSYQMINDLLNNKKTPLYIRLKLYFGILQKYGKKIFCLNEYLAEKFNVSIYQVKYHLKKLKDEGSIEIKNPKSFKREIVLLNYVFISEEDLTKELKQKNEDLRQSAFGRHRLKEHVYLTDEELYKIKELMTTEYITYINNLNDYIERTNKQYKSHFETLTAWWYKNQNAKKKKKKQEYSPEFIEEEFDLIEDNNDTWLGTSIDEWLEQFDQNYTSIEEE